MLNLKFTLRRLRYNKTFSLLNILGLGIGLSFTIIVFLYVDYEISFDRFYVDADQIYIGVKESKDLGSVFPLPFSESIQNEIPEVETAANILPWQVDKILTTPNGEFKENCSFMDEEIFSIFSFKIILRIQEKIFPDANSLAISKQLATKIFGSADMALGKTILLDKKYNGTVSAIFSDIPNNSSIRFDLAAPIQKAVQDYGITESWNDSYVRSFIKLNGTLGQAEPSIEAYAGKQSYSFMLFPLKELHLNQKDSEQKKMLTVAIIAALFIMLLACINFINLSTANTFKRAKEAGIHKLLGSSGSGILSNFLLETLLLTFMAFIIALIISLVILPYINQLIGSELSFSQLNIFKLILLFVFVCGVSLITALIPSSLFTKTQPIQILNKQIDKKNSIIYLRKGLLILQLTLTIIILTSTLFISKQIRFIDKSNLGFDKESMLFIEPGEMMEMARKSALLKEKLLQSPYINSVCMVDSKPGIIGSSTTGLSWPGKNAENLVNCFIYRVGDDFINTFKIKLIDGKGFSKEQTNSNKAIINKTFAQLIAEDDISKIQTIYFGKHPVEVVGIIDDFLFNSIKEKQKPSVILYDSSRGFYPSIRYSGNQHLPDILTQINKSMNELFPEMSYNTNFTNDFILKEFMARDIRLSKFFTLFTILGLLVCSIGLLGLALYESQKYTKEIGIRKVNGAKVYEILAMLNKDFVKWVIVAFIVASPIAWYTMHSWLENFAYKTELSWWIFTLAGILALGIAILTVSFQSWRAATKNPVEALRYE
ncbi:ABC transporter permease [Saccharicrinis sp. FJH2]|uniref:ABC transporter permease n=1 Tax=Saccharicrinis sp. FJH65 TaxID=3344659 RepID=UPI0035F3AC47